MRPAPNTSSPTANAFENIIVRIVKEVVDQLDYCQLIPQKFAFTPDEVAELAGFKNGRSVKAEATAGRLLGIKVCGQWRFTPEQIRDYLQENEVTT